MDADQVLVEAFPLWRAINSYTTVPFYTDEIEVKPYDAAQALKGLQQRTSDDPAWENFDWAGMTPRLIEYIDYRLQREGLTYAQVMDDRQRQLVADSVG
jgi:hypothetical protein